MMKIQRKIHTLETIKFHILLYKILFIIKRLLLKEDYIKHPKCVDSYLDNSKQFNLNYTKLKKHSPIFHYHNKINRKLLNQCLGNRLLSTSAINLLEEENKSEDKELIDSGLTSIQMKPIFKDLGERFEKVSIIEHDMTPLPKSLLLQGQYALEKGLDTKPKIKELIHNEKIINLYQQVLQERLQSETLDRHEYAVRAKLKNLKLNEDLINEMASFGQDISCLKDYNEQDIQLNEIYGLYNMKKYISQLQEVLSQLESNRIYKVLLKFEGSGFTSMGERKYDFKTSSPFLIYKDADIEALIIRFVNAYIDYISKYELDYRVDVVVLTKDWIVSSEYRQMQSLILQIFKNDEEYTLKFKEIIKYKIYNRLNTKFKDRLDKSALLLELEKYIIDSTVNIEDFKSKIEGLLNSNIDNIFIKELSKLVDNKEDLINNKSYTEGEDIFDRQGAIHKNIFEYDIEGENALLKSIGEEVVPVQDNIPSKSLNIVATATEQIINQKDKLEARITKVIERRGQRKIKMAKYGLWNMCKGIDYGYMLTLNNENIFKYEDTDTTKFIYANKYRLKDYWVIVEVVNEFTNRVTVFANNTEFRLEDLIKSNEEVPQLKSETYKKEAISQDITRNSYINQDNSISFTDILGNNSSLWNWPREADNLGFGRSSMIFNTINVENNSELEVLFLKIKSGELELNKLASWIDEISYEIDEETEMKKVTVHRTIENSNLKIEYLNGVDKRFEINYNCKYLDEKYGDIEFNREIGALDIETYLNKEGKSIPYAIAFKTPRSQECYYLGDFSSSDEMILKAIDDLMIPSNHNLTIYAHNMGKFDGIFILKALMNTNAKHSYELNPFCKADGSFVSISIKLPLKNKKLIKINIFDSNLLLLNSLDKLAKDFQCNYNKGLFPYSYIQEDNINSIVEAPSIKYFKEGTSQKDYNNFLTDLKVNYSGKWDTKIQTIKYLNSDVDILYEIMHKFADIIFFNFKINITRTRTISSLALLIYRSRFYKSDLNPIPLTKGALEEFIRESYYGGIVDVLEHYIKGKYYKYDVKSHYPFAMLKPMPAGTPKKVLIKGNDINEIFGFINCTITAPSIENLPVALLPIKNEFGQIELFRGTRTGTWFSEELKDVCQRGYKIEEIHSALSYDKKFGVFDDYVKSMYKLKEDAEKEGFKSKRLVFKILLNSLYGRFGLIDHSHSVKLIKEEDSKKLKHKKMFDDLYSSEGLKLIKITGDVDYKLQNILDRTEIEEITSENDEINDLESIVSDNSNYKDHSTAVQLCSAITAYGRIYLNRFKNMKNNRYLGGDTDSLILEKPLDPKFVGKNLGDLELEFVITEGFFLSKKFYLISTEDNKEIIKAKGLKNVKNLLNYEKFIELFKGSDLELEQTKFYRILHSLDIEVKPEKIKIKGLTDRYINNLFK